MEEIMRVKQKSAYLAQAMIEEQKAEPAARKPSAPGPRAPRVGRSVMELIEEEVRSERMDTEKALVSKVYALEASSGDACCSGRLQMHNASAPTGDP